ncbi:MAG: DUF4153 domain-containing protein [Pedobacter sp.]
MKFKLPSIASLWANTIKVFVRFPVEVTIALICAIVWYVAVDSKQDSEVTAEMIKFILVGNLAFTLSLSVDLYSEVNSFEWTKKWPLRVLVLALCTGLFFWLKPNFYDADKYRIALLAFAFHLLVAFAPFIRKGSLEGFWEYNKSLFLRFLASALYAGVLYIGLAAGLATIDALFNVNIDFVIYMRLFALVVAGFSTIFFLAGVPLVEELRSDNVEYPKGLRLFTQYVLIPLMTIYLAILLVYEVKIIIAWDFPKGMVSLLILGYAVFGMLSLLLIYPTRNKEGFGWIKLFSKFFYLMMIPLVILLLLAIWKRVSNYGITESRYILICLAGWLSFITLYFLISRKQNIKVIPASLCVLALLATYGPQSAFSVSRYSQLSRLRKLTESKAKDDDRAQVVRYLVQNHGLSTLQAFTKVDLEAMELRIAAKMNKRQRYAIRYDLVDTAYALLNIETEKSATNEYATFITADGATAINGYEFIISLDTYESRVESKINGVPFIIIKDVAKNRLMISIGGAKDAVVIDLNAEIIRLKQLYKQGKLNKTKEGYQTYFLPKGFQIAPIPYQKYELLFRPTTISGSVESGKNSNSDYKGFLLVRIK